MIANRKELIRFINDVMSAYGFVKYKDNWYYTTEECICIFHTSKSVFSGLFDPTMAATIRKCSYQMTYFQYILKRTFDTLSRI